MTAEEISSILNAHIKDLENNILPKFDNDLSQARLFFQVKIEDLTKFFSQHFAHKVFVKALFENNKENAEAAVSYLSEVIKELQAGKIKLKLS